MINIIPKVILVQLFLFFGNCNSQTSINKYEIADTLKVGYTYWWPESGPFIGNCGEKYSLVFLGIITDINKEVKNKNYITQEGSIQIENVLMSRKLEDTEYSTQEIFTSDCFYKQDLKVGEKVIVFCYEYEGGYSIPGGKSILKVGGNNDPIVKSIKRYIQSEQNPLSIKNDIDLWKIYNLDSDLKRIIECKEMMSK